MNLCRLGSRSWYNFGPPEPLEAVRCSNSGCDAASIPYASLYAVELGKSLLSNICQMYDSPVCSCNRRKLDLLQLQLMDAFLQQIVFLH